MKPWSIATLSLLVGALLGSYFVAPALEGQPKQPPPPQPRELTSYRELVKRVLPAVVSLEARAKGNANLPPPPEGEAPKGGLGSGVIVDPAGVVLSSNHLVEGAESVIVAMADGRTFTTRNIRGDKKTDLAILLLDAQKTGTLPFLPLGDSDAMEIGDRVLAVGAPFGLSGSVTHGIISGKGRSLNLNMYEDFLQTDAAINPGNSGGPLIALDAKVIGINAAIKSKNGGFQGVGLAVASNLCKSVVQALRTEGVFRRGYLGLFARDLTPQLAAQLGIGKTSGVLVGEVYNNTPAAKAGLQAGDVITSLDGKAITDPQMLQRRVELLPIQKAVTLKIVRDGKALSFKLTIEEQPQSFGIQRGQAQQPPGLDRGKQDR